MKERKRMYERISDIENRQILVNKLKNKINKEIKIQRKNHNELYKYNDDKDYVVNQIIKEEFAMIKLKEYLDYDIHLWIILLNIMIKMLLFII